MATNRTSPLQEATQQAGWRLHRLGRELRMARIAAGLTQASVARRLGLSHSQVSRIERGIGRHLTVFMLHRHASVVGLRASVQLYPGGRHVVDAPQLALLDRLRARLGDAFSWALEPMPIPNDLRAADALLTRGSLTILVEAITRLSDVQAQARAAQLKQRDLGATRVLLLVNASTANRRALRSAEPMLAAAFLTSTRQIVRMLAAGQDPGRDCLVVL